jgi:hypothetical protein
VNPSAIDPSQFLTFRNEYARPVKGHRIGRTTIAVLGLNRQELVEVRRDRVRTIRAFLQVRMHLAQQVANPRASREVRRQMTVVDAELDALTRDSEQFVGMARAACAGLTS